MNLLFLINNTETDPAQPSVFLTCKKHANIGEKSANSCFDPEIPVSKENNLIKVMSGKGLTMIPGLNGPMEPWFNTTWQPDVIDSVMSLVFNGQINT